MADVFISYSRKDKDFVRKLHDALSKLNRESWVDWQDIPPSAEWMKEIYSAIEGADTVVIVISPDSVNSSVCNDEVAHAVEHNKRLIPIVSREVDEKTVIEPLRKINWIFFRDTDDFEEAFEKFLGAIDTDLDWVRAHTRLLVRAIEWDAKKRDKSFLLRGRDLREAEQWLAQSGAREPKPSSLQTQYIVSSRTAATKRQWITLGFVAFGLVVAVSLAIIAFYQRQVAEERRKEAERQRYLTISQALAAYAPREQEQGRMDERAALLARQAFIFHQRHRGNRLDQIDRALRQVLSTPHFSVRLSTNTDKLQLTSLALSKDNQWLAVGGDDGKVRLWYLTKPESVPLFLNQKYGIIRSLTFGLRSDELFAGTEDGTIVSWKLDRRGNVTGFRELPGPADRRILAVAISPEGDRLASGSEDGKVRVWNLQKPAASPAILCCAGEEKAVWAVAFHPMEKNILASGGENRRVFVWDLRRPETPVRTMEGPDNTVKSLAFSPQGKEIACGTDRTSAAPSLSDMMKMFEKGEEPTELSIVGGTILMWNLEKADARASKLGSHEAAVTSLAFNPAGDMLASSSDDKTIGLWQLRQSKGSPIFLRGHESGVISVGFGQDGQVLASVGRGDSSVRLWDMRLPGGVPKILRGHKGAILSLAFSPDSEMIASADGEEDGVRLWTLDKAKTKTLLQHPKGQPVSVGYHPSQEIVASGSDGGILDPENTVCLWDPGNPGKPKDVLPHLHKSSVHVLVFSSNGTLMASAGRFDQEIVIWDLNQLEKPQAVLPTKPPANISSLAFGSGDHRLAAACDDKTVRIWDLQQQTQDPIILKGHEAPVDSVTFAPDGSALFSGDESGNVYRWDLREPKGKPATIEKWEGKVYSLAMSADGTSLASGSSDGKVRIWDLVSTSSDSRVLRGPGANVYTVAFSPNGRWLAAGGSDTTILVWPSTGALVEMVCEKVRRNLYETEWQQLVGRDIPYELTCPNLPYPKGP